MSGHNLGGEESLQFIELAETAERIRLDVLDLISPQVPEEAAIITL